MVFEGRSDLSGRTIAGRYELRDVLGRGGMATVYRAYQRALDREVAVKIIASDLAQEPGFVERFRREAHIVARLRHPNILTVHDFGEEDGLIYLVTELIAGGTLQSRLHELRSSDRAVELIAQVGAALDYAHAQGIIHRDVKPLNIFLDRRGDDDEVEQAVLADFGIARATAETTGGLTGEGLSVGTPEYMAPEQLTGQPVDGRADLYALAVIAYQLLTGRLPIPRGGPQDTPLVLAMRKTQTPPPAPTTFNPHLPSAIDRVLLRALAIEPRDRFATAADFVGALRAALAARGSTAPPRNPAATFTPQSPTWDYPPLVNQAATVPLPPAVESSPPPLPPSEASPPTVAYQPPPAYQRPPEPRPAAAYMPAPQTLPAGGAPLAPPAIVAPNPPPPAATRRSWLPIAGILAVTLVAIIFAGVFGRGLLSRAGVGVTSTATATARPAGTIAVIGSPAIPTATIGAAPTATSAATTVAVLPATPTLPTPSAVPTPTPTAAPTATAAPPTATVAPPTATAPPPTATLPPASPTRTGTAAASTTPTLPVAPGPPTGTLLYSSDKEGRWAIYHLNPDGSGERRLTDLSADNYHGVWSPDGTMIAFVSERDNNPEIYLMNPDGGNQRRITTDQGQHLSPAWGSDSRRVAYVLKNGGVEAVYYIDLSNGRRTGLINAQANWPAWSSRDDIAWTRVEGGFVTIYLSTVTGSASARLPRPTAQSEDTPAFSPDGNFLAFTGGAKENRQIIVSTASGANRRAITARGADNSNPVWSPDGAYIAYSSNASGTQQIIIMRNDGTEATTITTGGGAKWYLSWR